jgi:hypothetical protein
MMERRSYQRIPASLRVEFDCNRTICCSSVINLSENGMLLRAKGINFPMDMKFEIIICLEDGFLVVPAKVKRLAKTKNIYDIISIELINPPQTYVEYVDRLRSSMQ